jgi:hypothetical protein
MRALAGVVLLYAAVAAAQPGGEPRPPGPQEPMPPGEPVPPGSDAVPQGSDAPPPADTSNGQIVVTDPNAPAPDGPAYVPPPPKPFDPLDDDGFPRGRTMEELRALPACGPEGLPHEAGALISCRPVIEPAGIPFGMGFDYTTGAAFGTVASGGGVHGFGADLYFGVTRSLQFGVRYEALGISVSREPGEGSHAAPSHHLFGTARLRLWTDETGRNAWTFGGGFGLALRGDSLGGIVPVLRGSIAREVGHYYTRHASLAAIELAYEHSVADPNVRAILASLRFGFESNVITPKNLGTPAQRSSHLTSMHVLLSAWLGMGMSVGVPLGSVLRWETTGDFLTGLTEEKPKVRLYEDAQWSARTGLRLRSGVAYLLAQGGLSWFGHHAGGELESVWHGEVGFDFGLVSFGGWLRGFFEGGLDSGGFVMHFATGLGGGGSGGGGMRLQREYVHVQRQQVDVGVDVDVTIDVKPIVIEVPLGVSVLGVGVRIDIDKLPLAELRRAGFVQVELSGPAGDLSQFQAQLSGTLDSRGVRVDGWSSVETDAHIVRAKFTIWPTGSKPPI